MSDPNKSPQQTFTDALTRGVFGTVLARFARGSDLPPRFPAGSAGERIGQSVIAGLFGRRIPPRVPPTTGAAPGPTPGPSPVDRGTVVGGRWVPPNIRAVERLLAQVRTGTPQGRVFEWLRGQLRGRKRGKAKGRRGLKWQWVNGRWVQYGRGLLRGGAASVLATAVLNLPNPTPTQQPRVRVRDAQGRPGPWRYKDPRTGKYTATAPGSGGGGNVGARGRTAAPAALPGGASSSSSRTGGGVLAPVQVTSRRIPSAYIPAPRPVTTRQRILGAVAKYGPALVPLLLPAKDKAPRVSVGVGQPVTQVVPQAYPFPLTAVGSAGVGSRTCPPGCRPEPKKRKPRGKRTVCYQGTYTETASGLRKTKRRKVPCR